MPLRHRHTSIADTASPSSAHHQFAVLSSEKNVGTVLMNG